MVELLKKHKVIIILLLLVIANIGWYVAKESKEREVSTKLNNQNSQSAGWQEHTASLETAPENILENTLDSALVRAPQSEPVQVPLNEPNQTMTLIEDLKVPVYICGAINLPGVYYVDRTTILNDIVQLGGGFTTLADTNFLNLASTIVPNQKIYIPKIGEEIDKTVNSYENIEVGAQPSERISTPQVNQETHRQLININTATEKELQSLVGIGEVKAKAIIQYRMTIGRFKTIDELLNVTGIGSKTLEKMKPFITV